MSTPREERQQRLLEYLSESGKVDVSSLSLQFDVAEMTIRRDLEMLEAIGALKRVHGGALLPVGSSYEPPFSLRQKTNSLAKRNIGSYVASQVADGDTLILDGGSTGLAIAEALISRVLTVTPLSLRVANYLSESTTVSLLIPGGAIRQGEKTFIGAETMEYLSNRRYDHFLMTASAVSVTEGITEWNSEDAAIKRRSLQVTSNVILAADSSKFNHHGFVNVCPLSTPDLVVTDSAIKEIDLKPYLETNMHIKIAPNQSLPRR
jgi:DeoR family transcriptional regulator, fructose operon transcriptional repressor